MNTRSTGPRVRRPDEIRRQRRQRPATCFGHLIAAPLWPQHGLNLGTLLRTCDAVSACLAVPPYPWVPEALARGNTLRRPACVHTVGSPERWLRDRRARGSRIVAVELVEGAVRLGDLPAARQPTVMVLGHESTGIPERFLELAHATVEIPMIGTGASLNVAVAGSLVLYRLSGLL